MANLSNINNILRISSSGVGLNKDNTGPSELDIESAGADIIDMTRTGQKTYRFAISGASAFSLFDVAANADRLVINSAGNATFAGNVTANTGSKITSSSADTTFSIETTSGTTIFPILDFVSSHSTAGTRIRVDGTDVISIDKSQNATFAGETYFNKGVRFYRYTDQANYWSVYTNTDDSLRFNYNGSGNDEITIDSSGNSTFAGNVNITGGTTSGLNITTSGTQDTININRAANNDNAITKYQTASVDKWIVGLRNTGDDNFRFYSYGTSTDVLTIDQTNGNVGIGQTPYSYSRLSTEGSDNTSSNYAFIAYNQNTDAILACRNDGQVTMPTGNVGIGTSLPTTALTIRKAISPTGYGEQASMIEFKSYYTGYDTETVKSAIHSGVSGQTGLQTARGFMSFWTSSYSATGVENLTEKMRIESDGNVGIGTASPGYPLEVNGRVAISSASAPQLLFFEPGRTYTEAMRLLRYEDKLSLTYGWNANEEALTVVGTGSTAGYVGIGTISPSRALDVTQTALIQGAGNVNAGTLALGPRASGVGKWSTISGAHYNQSSGSGNGSGAAGIMMIGTYGANGENDIYIGGGLYEVNAATRIGFYTHTTDTSTAGGTERMRITSGGNVEIASGGSLYLKNSGGNNWNILSYGNGQLYLQQDGVTNLGVFDGTSGAYTALSDVNKKKDFEDSKIGLKEVMGLKPKLYRMKTHSEDSDKLLGFLAQEVKEFIPQAYVENGADDNKFIGLNEMPIIAALTKAIQELTARIETLENN